MAPIASTAQKFATAVQTAEMAPMKLSHCAEQSGACVHILCKSSCIHLILRCPNNSFRCQYGGCIDKDLRCNGNQDCADNSDEDDFLCGCRMPVFPDKSYFNVLGCPGERLGTLNTADESISEICKVKLQLSNILNHFKLSKHLELSSSLL